MIDENRIRYAEGKVLKGDFEKKTLTELLAKALRTEALIDLRPNFIPGVGWEQDQPDYENPFLDEYGDPVDDPLANHPTKPWE